MSSFSLSMTVNLTVASSSSFTRMVLSNCVMTGAVFFFNVTGTMVVGFPGSLLLMTRLARLLPSPLVKAALACREIFTDSSGCKVFSSPSIVNQALLASFSYIFCKKPSTPYWDWSDSRSSQVPSRCTVNRPSVAGSVTDINAIPVLGLM